jgi:hypothetical protein
LIELNFRSAQNPRTTLPPWLPGRCAEFRATFRAIPALVGWRVIQYPQVNGFTEIDGETRFGQK